MIPSVIVTLPDAVLIRSHYTLQGLDPDEYVEDMKRQAIRVPGIGHRIKSKDNRDKRVELLIKYARHFFPATKYLDYALRVEQYTLQKAANLVMNVDGCIGALFLDLLHSSSMFNEVVPTHPSTHSLIRHSPTLLELHVELQDIFSTGGVSTGKILSNATATLISW